MLQVASKHSYFAAGGQHFQEDCKPYPEWTDRGLRTHCPGLVEGQILEIEMFWDVLKIKKIDYCEEIFGRKILNLKF